MRLRDSRKSEGKDKENRERLKDRGKTERAEGEKQREGERRKEKKTKFLQMINSIFSELTRNKQIVNIRDYFIFKLYLL